MMVGQFSLVLTGACQFGHGLGGFTTDFIHSFKLLLESLTLGEASMGHLVCMQISHGHEPRSSSGQSCGHQPASQSDSEIGTTAGGDPPGSGLGSSSGIGADRAFRIAKSETMKRVDHKR